MLSENEAERLIAIANKRLGKAGLRLELGGKKLNISVRGMFPPRPEDKRKTWYQTRLSLKMRAVDREAIQQAEVTAREIALALNKGVFSWQHFSDAPEAEGQTLAAMVAEYERLWWRGKSRSDPAKKDTWRNYQACLRKLPAEINSLDELLDWIASDNTQSMRRYYCAIAKSLAEMMNFPTKEISKFSGVAPTLKAVNPRLLPTDEAIAAMRESIRDPGWQYIFGLMATYGLRNHEVWWLDLSDFPIVRVREGTKTGSRPVYPYYPEWAEKWQLDQVVYPRKITVSPEMGNGKLGLKVTRWFRRKLKVDPYDYRHCYARRLLQFGLPVDVGSKLMGHSINVHQKIYRAWIGEKVYLDAASVAGTREGRPQAPSI